jgi:NADPH:quinone reductase-like Zn-dependent oxidoreductase
MPAELYVLLFAMVPRALDRPAATRRRGDLRPVPGAVRGRASRDGSVGADGEVSPVIDRTYQLSETPEAIRYLEAGHARGKVVITV